MQVAAEVYDDANPDKVGTGNLTITVRRNERGPRFERTDYTENLLETTPIGTVVLQMSARDEDDDGVSLSWVIIGLLWLSENTVHNLSFKMNTIMSEGILFKRIIA